MKKLLASLFLALTLVACGGGGDAPTACEVPIDTTTESPGPGPSIGGVTAQTYKTKPPVEVIVPNECDEVVSPPPPREQIDRCLYGCGSGRWVWDQTNWAAVVEYNGAMSTLEHQPLLGGEEIGQQVAAVVEANMTTVYLGAQPGATNTVPAVDVRVSGPDPIGKYYVHDLATGQIITHYLPTVINGKRYVPIYRKRWSMND